MAQPPVVKYLQGIFSFGLRTGVPSVALVELPPLKAPRAADAASSVIHAAVLNLDDRCGAEGAAATAARKYSSFMVVKKKEKERREIPVVLTSKNRERK